MRPLTIPKDFVSEDVFASFEAAGGYFILGAEVDDVRLAAVLSRVEPVFLRLYRSPQDHLAHSQTKI